MLALKRFHWSQRKAKARQYALRSHAPNSIRLQRRSERGPSFETIQWRAKQDRRGSIDRKGCTFTARGEKHWLVIRSILGRTDQFDLVVNGITLCTGGKDRVAEWFGKSSL